MKTKKTYFLTLILLGFFGLNNYNGVVNAANPKTEEDLKTFAKSDMMLVNYVCQEAEKLISANRYTTFSDLEKQLADRMEKNSEVLISTTKQEKMNGNHMYFYLQERTVFISKGVKEKGKSEIGFINLSGYIINEDGVIITNWHPFDKQRKGNMDFIGMFVTTNDGKVYSVKKVLSSSKINDISILQLDTHGDKLKALPFAEEELVGQDIYVMGHPVGRIYTMTKGIISRKYIDEFDNEPRIGVTADFAQGASGGPIVNENGQLVGMVRATFTLYTGDGTKEHGEVQMVVKQAIPVSIIHKYVKQK
jgi:S1-C subfamily serine protease